MSKMTCVMGCSKPGWSCGDAMVARAAQAAATVPLLLRGCVRCTGRNGLAANFGEMSIYLYYHPIIKVCIHERMYCIILYIKLYTTITFLNDNNNRACTSCPRKLKGRINYNTMHFQCISV